MFSGFSPCPLFVEKLKFYGMSGAATGWNVMKASALGSRCASGRVQGSIVGSTVLRVYNYESTESRRQEKHDTQSKVWCRKERGETHSASVDDEAMVADVRFPRRPDAWRINKTTSDAAILSHKWSPLTIV
jgi:hypothetical protein